MKKIKFIQVVLLLLVFSGIFLTSCKEDSDDVQDSVTTEKVLDLRNMKISSFDDFQIEDDQTFDLSQFNEKDKNKFIENKINNIYGKLDKILSEHKDVTAGYVYLNFSKNEFSIKGMIFHQISINEEKTSTDKYADPLDFELAGWSCPEGYSNYGTCWSAACVADALNDIYSGISSGQTISTVIHHGGISGVTICYK